MKTARGPGAPRQPSKWRTSPPSPDPGSSSPLRDEAKSAPLFFFFFWRAVPSVSRPLRSALPRWHVTFIWFDSSLFSLIDTPPFFLKQPPFYFYFSLFVYLIPSSNSWSYSLSFEGHLALPISLLCQRSRLHHSQTIITAASTAGSKA